METLCTTFTFHKSNWLSFTFSAEREITVRAGHDARDDKERKRTKKDDKRTKRDEEGRKKTKKDDKRRQG